MVLVLSILFIVGVQCFWNRQHFINWKWIGRLVSYQTGSLCWRLKSQRYFQLSLGGESHSEPSCCAYCWQWPSPGSWKTCPKARKRQWQRKRNLQHFACAATSEEGPQVSLLPGVDLFQDLATEKADLQGFVSFTFEVHYRQRTGTSIPNFAFYSKTLNRYIEILCNTVSVFFDLSVCHHTQHISHWSNLAFICLF